MSAEAKQQPAERDFQVFTRVTREEGDRLWRAAEASERTLSSQVRFILREWLKANA